MTRTKKQRKALKNQERLTMAIIVIGFSLLTGLIAVNFLAIGAL